MSSINFDYCIIISITIFTSLSIIIIDQFIQTHHIYNEPHSLLLLPKISNNSNILTDKGINVTINNFINVKLEFNKKAVITKINMEGNIYKWILLVDKLNFTSINIMDNLYGYKEYNLYIYGTFIKNLKCFGYYIKRNGIKK